MKHQPDKYSFFPQTTRGNIIGIFTSVGIAAACFAAGAAVVPSIIVGAFAVPVISRGWELVSHVGEDLVDNDGDDDDDDFDDDDEAEDAWDYDDGWDGGYDFDDSGTADGGYFYH